MINYYKIKPLLFLILSNKSSYDSASIGKYGLAFFDFLRF